MNPLSPIQKILQRFSGLLNRGLEKVDSSDDIMIQPYRGYTNTYRLFFKGRVMENEELSDGQHESKRLNLKDSLKRMETDELPNVQIEIAVKDRKYTCLTDNEGYFRFDVNWQTPVDLNARWLPVECNLPNLNNEDKSPVVANGEIFFPHPQAEYGIISDIDDTVLQTHVTSTLKLKMLYTTFMKNASQRLPMEGIVDLLQAFERGSDGQQENPFFYVSSSPWNLYDLLEQFMTFQKLPKGPILLRDYGIDPSGPFMKHKLSTITHILQMYPDLPFIMLGDTASSDADYYLEMANQFPNRVKAIYIRQTKNNRNARRMAELMASQNEVEAVMVKSSSEIWAHARKIGLLKTEVGGRRSDVR